MALAMRNLLSDGASKKQIPFDSAEGRLSLRPST
jgi:hypothetical protein